MSLPAFMPSFTGTEIRTVEMHTSGEPARIVYAGYPDIPGTLLEQRSLAQSQHDHIRRSIIYEPRGHADMYGAVLRPRTELVDAGEAHMGALFLTHEGYGAMCGHATIALGRFLVDCADEAVFPQRRDLVFDEEEGTVEIRLHAPVGVVRLTVPVVKMDGDMWKTDVNRRITFLSVPTFATAIDLSVPIPQSLRWPELGDAAAVTIDVAFGGALYAVVSAAALGFTPSLSKPDVSGLRNATKKLKQAVNASAELGARCGHPNDGEERSPQSLVYGIMVTDTDSDDVLATAPGCVGAETGLYFFGDQQIDRSPTGSVVQARVALAAARGTRRLGALWTYHSLVSRAVGGHRGAFVGAPVEEVEVGGRRAWRVEVSGQAHYTGSSTFVMEAEDDIGGGFSFQGLEA
ncbi:proline racemase [Colletotrichum orchidophilum]|uniref:trans-L-3-hydroxyproline dehydratase n=1 Tax=Colletotrichum orchidophilum TaxID=1209926 RepID=A0A1G4BP94_9PEZI|nr:proline racemase [Colletotrichum orchidophilum]OHF03125.1 proline racemase [Colletotrichum orchidophilum]